MIRINIRLWACRLSTVLSALILVLIGISTYTTNYLEGRARWSGDEAPQAWMKASDQSDVFQLAGYNVAYWGKPDARYSKYATRSKRKPIAVVVHHTAVKPVKNLVKYGHISDPNRGGASFGYHFYIGRDGNIVQGAPLSKRTNHIKFKTNKQRRKTAKHLWSGNTIALTMVGGCDPLMRPRWGQWHECADEFVTKSQLKAGLALVRALQLKYGIKCKQVYGHGDLQFDRQNFEGFILSRLARRGCDLEMPLELDGDLVVVEVATGQRMVVAKVSGPSGS